MNKTIIMVSLLLLPGCFGGSSAPPQPQSTEPAVLGPKLGTLKKEFGRLGLNQEVDRLPLVPSTHGDIANNFGICFDYRGGTKLRDLAVIVRPPGQINTGSVQLTKQAVDGGIRMDIPRIRQYSGTFCQAMFFEKGDPPGIWSFDLVQDQTLLGRWNVNVYAP